MLAYNKFGNPADAAEPFSCMRVKPLILWVVEAGLPFVFAGGGACLSEEYFDGAKACEAKLDIGPVFYDFILCGGEPYSVWF